MAKTLKEGLEELFQQLEQKGLVNQSMMAQKENIIGSLALTLQNNLNPEDLNDPLVKMRLQASMVCKGLGLDQFGKIFTDALNKDPKAEPTGKEKGLMTVLTLLKVLRPDNDPKAKETTLSDKITNEFKKLCLKHLGEGNRKADPRLLKELKEADENLVELNNRTLNGGKNPSSLDAIASIVLCVSAGDQFNSTKQEASYGESNSFLEDLTSGDNNQSLGGPIDTITELNRYLKQELETNELDTNSNWPPKPSGPGGIPVR